MKNKKSVFVQSFKKQNVGFYCSKLQTVNITPTYTRNYSGSIQRWRSGKISSQSAV